MQNYYAIHMLATVTTGEPALELWLNICELKASNDVPVPPQCGARDEVTARYEEREHSRPEQANAARLRSTNFHPS